MVLWRATCDKIGFEHTTLLPDEAWLVLVAERARRPATGTAWVFPACDESTKPVARDRVRHWWQRAAVRAKLPPGRRLGWHSVRRQWTTEMKDTPIRDLCYMGGWKSPMTVLTCYQFPDPERQRLALGRRRKFSGGGLGSSS